MDEKKSKGQQLMESLSYKKKNFFEISSEKEIKEMYDYSEGYKKFLDEAKTEREAVAYAVRTAEAKGYKPYKLGDKLKIGDKRYYNNRDKSVAFFKIGKNDLTEDGIRIVAAHIDSPRLDLKQNPLYEDSGFCLLKTHYYGGIKKISVDYDSSCASRRGRAFRRQSCGNAHRRKSRRARFLH